MIDYTASIDRNGPDSGHPVQYVLNDLKPFVAEPARVYSFGDPKVLSYPPNEYPLLSKAIASEIIRKIGSMGLDLG